jgi:hypothetical protein
MSNNLENKENQFAIILQDNGIKENKKAEMLTFTEVFISKIPEWESLESGIVVASHEDTKAMKEANKARLAIRKERLAAEKHFDSKRTEVQALMADYKAEDSAWLKLKQKFVEVCSSFESKLSEKETTKERYDAEQKQKLRADRLEILAKYTDNPGQYMSGELTQEAFDSIISGLEMQHKAKIEAERMAEETRLIAEAKKLLSEERRNWLSSISTFIPNWETIDFGELSDDEFTAIQKKANSDKAEYEAEQERIKAENERLKAEKIEMERKAEEERKQAAEKARIEKAKQDEILAKERAKAEEEKKKIEAEKAKIQAQLDAKRKADEAEKAKQEELLKEQQEAERLAFLAPDKDKLSELIVSLTLKELSLSSENSRALFEQLGKRLEQYKSWAIAEVNKL